MLNLHTMPVSMCRKCWEIVLLFQQKRLLPQLHRIDGNTVLDKLMTAKEILETYDEITIDQQVFDDVLFFTLFEKKFLFWPPSTEDPTSQASIYLYNDEFLDFPHVMLRAANITDGKEIPNGTYRWVCLFEHNSIVNSLVSYEDKIFDTIDRLIELLSMNQVDREREFQKEFMLYWNSEAVD